MNYLRPGMTRNGSGNDGKKTQAEMLFIEWRGGKKLIRCRPKFKLWQK
jgi:hypothetical protein